MTALTKTLRLGLGLLFLAFLASCGKNFKVSASADVIPPDRSQKQCQKKVCLTASVPSPEETKKIFGVPLENKGIQPVWLRIENQSKGDVYLLPSSIDPEYYSPNEAAYKFRIGFNRDGQKKMAKHFNQLSLNPYVPPRQVFEGFLFTHLDRDRKEISPEILGDREFWYYSFIIPVPGFKADYQEVDFDALYKKEEMKNFRRLEDLRRALEELPCCTFKKGEYKGDGVNLVVIGDDEDITPAFVRSGWRETEAKSRGTALKTLKAYLSRHEYKYAPMSDLNFFGRKQDFGMQKPRETPHERNHFRLWLAPFTFQGKSVWVGTISRDIGIIWTTKSPYLFITHKIDPDIDETREYLIQDLIYAQAVNTVGWVKGVGQVSIDQPRKDPMGNAYFTDGLRAVLFISGKPSEIDEIEFLDWEDPPPPQK